MPIASGSRHGLRYAAETDTGVTPAPLTMTALRHTACSLALSKENIVSEELRPDRQISDMRMVGNKVGGSTESRKPAFPTRNTNAIPTCCAA